jgi:hypothetical protein
MRIPRYACGLSFVALLAIYFYSPAHAEDTALPGKWMPKKTLFPEEAVEEAAPAAPAAPKAVEPLRYTWMLPRTVIDMTIVYTFDSCSDTDKGAEMHIKITPTLVARAIPDTSVGRLGINPNDLIAFWSDKSISLQTFGGSHILNSIGSAPANQAGQIIANILGGVTKLVAVGFGVPAVAAAPPAGPAVAAAVSKCGTAKKTKDDLNNLKTKIKSLQADLENGVGDATQKKDAIEALQTEMTSLQTDLTLTVKKTIDPGFSPIEINTNTENSKKPNSIDKTGKIAAFDLSDRQLKKAQWYNDVKDISKDERSRLQVNVYLDFPYADVPVKLSGAAYQQTSIDDGYIYRAVAYIPVLVWLGSKPMDAALSTQPPDDTAPPAGAPVQLIAPQRVAFAQYGVQQTLPLSPQAFQNLTWSVTFLENGEVTNASFVSKASGVNASSFLGTVASNVNSIATEERSAASPENQAVALQGQADLIYQSRRLALCQANPAGCPSK